MPTVETVLDGMAVVSDQGSLGLATTALIRGRQNILVDVGHYGRRQLLVQSLWRLGLTPDDIGLVVLTHAHWDHVQNVDLFPGAWFLIHPNELQYSWAPLDSDWATPRYFPHMLRGLQVWEVTDGVEIEPGVRIIETPGHTRGHISVVVDTPDGIVVVAGDAFTDAYTAISGRPGLIFWSEQQARSSVRRVLERGNIIYPGHDRPFRQISGGGTQYQEGVASIRITTGFSPNQLGVTVSTELTPVRIPETAPEARDCED